MAKLAIAFLLILGAFAYPTSGSPVATQAINAAVASYTSSHPAGTISLIIETQGDTAGVEWFVREQGGSIDQRYPVINAFSATVSTSLARQLNHDSRVKRLNLNLPVKWLGSAVDSSQLVNRYNAMSHVPNAWSAGLDGSEVQVAVVDTGVWPHDDLTKAAPGVPGNTGNRLIANTTNIHATDVLDHYGHGTHVAGIVAGNGYDSGGQYLGVAPNSLLVSVKVSDDLGNANEGDVINGLEWIYQANRHGMHIKVVNLSLASSVAQSFHQSSLDAEVEKLWLSGVTVVAAAGNGSGAVQYAPGNDPFVITVGSVDDNYQASRMASPMASWALYGRTQDGFNKPEIVADGSHVVSLNAPASALSAQHPLNMVGATYFKMGGTSMAAPQVAGMAALMLQNNPRLSNGTIKRELRHSSLSFGGTAYTSWLGLGGGFMDAGAINDMDHNDDNLGVPTSSSFDPGTGNILAGGAWYTGVSTPDAPWTSVAWNSVAWNSVAWNSVAWNNNNSGSPVMDASSVAWNSVAWNSVAWNSVAWNSVAWNSVAWNSVAWNSVAWNDASWN
ncbi:MAG: serine protease AprX [Chloroflexota bacterium]|jgi:serine protease AprX|nr:serine protease AprX [Chloroflexota bacterium]